MNASGDYHHTPLTRTEVRDPDTGDVHVVWWVSVERTVGDLVYGERMTVNPRIYEAAEEQIWVIAEASWERRYGHLLEESDGSTGK